MGLDEHGMLWLADPWSAAAFCVAVLGLFLFIHRCVSAARPPAPRSMAVRVRRPRLARRGIARHAPLPSLARAVAFDPAPRPTEALSRRREDAPDRRIAA